jgi:hypothetical protein
VRTVLEGELLARARTARDFDGLLPHPAGPGRCRPDTSLSFWAFDSLWLSNELCVDRPYSDGHDALPYWSFLLLPNHSEFAAPVPMTSAASL